MPEKKFVTTFFGAGVPFEYDGVQLPAPPVQPFQVVITPPEPMDVDEPDPGPTPTPAPPPMTLVRQLTGAPPSTS
jgi:hypothetical protein